MPVFRFGVRAQPTPNNPKYATWQPGHILAFIVADDESAAEKRFKAKIGRLHWKILEWKLRDELIEERVRQSGGEVLAVYELALRRGEWYRVDSEHFMAQTMAKNPISPPRPDELFLDRIIIAAGGRGLTKSERGDEGQNADYILDEFVIEAKDLQEERLAKKECQTKIAEIFWPYFEEDAVIPITPSVLSNSDRSLYYQIIARPMERQIEKACHQVKATIERMHTVGWRGGLVLLNSGYYSLPHKFLEEIAATASTRSQLIELVICITAKAQTNGFDCYMNWEFSPKNPRTDIAQRIFAVYDNTLHAVMTDWMRDGIAGHPNHQPLTEPVSFEYGGKTFMWDSGTAPFSSEQIANVMAPP